MVAAANGFWTVDGRALLTAEYRLEGTPTRLVTTLGRADELGADGPLARIVAGQLSGRRPGEDAAVELYVLWPGSGAVEASEASAATSATFCRLPLE